MPAPPDRDLIGLLELLLHEHPTLLSREEIIRELDLSEVAFGDNVTHLKRVGLVHELGGFYWATRSAIAADELKSWMPPEAFYVARTMQVLELLAFQPLSAPQVAATLQIHPRTARRILVRLHEEGYLIRSSDTRRRYAPSMRIVSLAGQITAHSPLLTRARPVVERLHRATGAAAHLIVPSYLSVLCVVHADGSRDWAFTRELVPAHCTAGGKALLAWRQRWRDSVLGHQLERHTARTIVDPLILARESDAARARGYATDDGEFKNGVRGVAAPVFIGGEAVAAIGISGRGIDPHARGEHVNAAAAELFDLI